MKAGDEGVVSSFPETFLRDPLQFPSNGPKDGDIWEDWSAESGGVMEWAKNNKHKSVMNADPK